MMALALYLHRNTLAHWWRKAPSQHTLGMPPGV